VEAPLQSLNRVVIACSTTLLLAACAKSEPPKADTAAAAAAAPAPAPPPAPAPIALADLTGTWKMRTVPASGTDTVPTDVVLNATADAKSWTLTLPSGTKVPLTVVAAGDSIVTTSGVFPSLRRKGAKVMTVSTLRMVDGKLKGTTVAHYQKAGADSVLILNAEAVKQP
jgi:hypothetical protein